MQHIAFHSIKHHRGTSRRLILLSLLMFSLRKRQKSEILHLSNSNSVCHLYRIRSMILRPTTSEISSMEKQNKHFIDWTRSTRKLKDSFRES